MDISELNIKPPKELKNSTTIAKSKLVRTISWMIGIIDTVGVGILLTICPPEYRPHVELGIVGISVVGMALNIKNANSMIKERKRRFDLFGPDDGIANTAEEAIYWIGANYSQFQDFKEALKK